MKEEKTMGYNVEKIKNNRYANYLERGRLVETHNPLASLVSLFTDEVYCVKNGEERKIGNLFKIVWEFGGTQTFNKLEDAFQYARVTSNKSKYWSAFQTWLINQKRG